MQVGEYMEDFIFGRNSVYELLTEGKRSVSKIILMKGMKENSKISQIIDIAKRKGIIFQFMPKEKFIQFKECSHQGVVAYVSPVKYVEFEDFLEREKQYKKVIIFNNFHVFNFQFHCYWIVIYTGNLNAWI